MTRGGALALVVVAACGGEAAGPDAAVPWIEVVGHTDLGARGMNSALAVAGDTVYVGSRTDQRPVLIVDIADPGSPVVVGELGLPDLALPAMSSRELRAVADLDLLVVLNLVCSPDAHNCAQSGGEVESLKLYDISDRRVPVLTAVHAVPDGLRTRRSPHEFYLRRTGDQVLIYLTTPPGGPSFEVVDVSDRAAPVQVLTWDPAQDGLIRSTSDNLFHSVSVSADGRHAYLSHQQGGLLVADVSNLPSVSLITPPLDALKWPPLGTIGPHSAVPVPGRDLLVVTEEVYPMPSGRGCPWGPLRTVDVSNPAAPVLLGTLGLPENQAASCVDVPANTAFTTHNPTVTEHLALVSWYAGGFQVIDISDPTRMVRLAELRPAPLAAVAMEDPVLGGNPVEMWSYPVVQDGLIYVVDSRNGLYVLRYHGPWQEDLERDRFIEGNSNL